MEANSNLEFASDLIGYDSEGESVYTTSLSTPSSLDEVSSDIVEQYKDDQYDPLTVIRGIFHLADSESENIEVEIKHVFISLVNLYQKLRNGVPTTESYLPFDFSRYINANGSKSGVIRKRCGELVPYPDSQKRKFKLDGLLPPPPQKNTVAMLNELRQGLVYELEGQTGPVHAPVFTMSVIVDGEKYTGQGRSKKIARIEAAASALKSFIQFKDGTALNALKPIKNIDFTSDDHLENETVMPTYNNTEGQKQVPEKGPVMLLYELFTDVAFECNSSDGPPHSRFKMTVKVNEQNFIGTGSSKKLAKNAAAKAALAALCNISYSPMQQVQPNMNLAETLNMECDQNITLELPQLFADTIGKLVVEKFSDLMIGNSQFAKRKVLAGIVMTENFDVDSAKVLTISTGTKCINGEHMSLSGCVLNDSHAEIVSRRCLMDFFYTQLELLTTPNGANESIFIRSSGPDVDKFPYKLKPGIRFHLYINTSPCGDARIFSPHEDDLGVDKHPNRKARGQLRNKIEAGEGTIPAKSSDGIQTWDGIIQGQRLLTMSCSDKIARWNVLGIQGALLTSIIEPIYLYSIVLGRLLHPAHMYRAVYGRLENAIEQLPPPYHLNKPKLAEVTSSEVRNQSKAPSFGINWTVGNPEIEVVNSITGKTASTKVSRLTKLNFFKRYANLVENLPGIEGALIKGDYGEAKAAVIDYNVAKLELFAAFRRKDLGNWLKKPIDQDQFMLPE